MIRAPFNCLLTLALLAILAGCNSVNTVEPAESKAEPNLIAIKKVETDPALARRVSVIEVNEGTAGDLLRVQVKLENLNYGPEDFNYQFSWIDQDGFEIQSPPPSGNPTPFSAAKPSTSPPSPPPLESSISA